MTKKLLILLVDDDKNFVSDFITLSQQVFSIQTAYSGEKALGLLETNEPDAIVLDLRLGTGIDGLETLKKIRQKYFEMPVIMVTDHADVETAVKAIKLGAVHYTSKHPNMKELHAIVCKELDHLKWKKLYHDALESRYGALIGKSPIMKSVFKIIDKVAHKDCDVLIQGKTGTGKDLVAREIHKKSTRSGNPFIAVNCGAIPAALFESELFGHEKGAFTGAFARKQGKFELANNGILFLDELSSLSLENQAKLLTAIENKCFYRVGGKSEVQVDVRVVAATNVSLEALVKKGEFREDLFYRLSVVPIDLPLLKERSNDVQVLIEHFNEKYSQEYRSKKVKFTKDAMDRMRKYDWPGNVRELKNLMQRLVVLHPGLQIDAKVLKLYDNNSQPNIYSKVLDLPYKDARERILADFKKNYLRFILEKNNGNYAQAAKEAGLPRPSLHRMAKEIKEL